MANSKISALPSATTPVAGTETLPIVQSGATKQVSVANLTAGRSVATGPLAVSGTGNVLLSLATTTSGSPIFWVAPAGGGNAITAWSTGQAMRFATADNSNLTNFVERVKIDGAGNTTLTTGNLVQGTAAKGVNFTANTPAAGMTSQLLNWYEEGTWTPVVTSSTGAITSYTASGWYTRIGRQVTLHWNVGVSNNGTGAGYIIVNGAPYSSPIANISLYGFNQSSGVACTGSINGTTIDMYKYDATYPVATGQTINGTITYIV